MVRVDDSQAELVDIHQAATITGRHPETVRRWIWSGRLSARKEGHRLLVDRAALEELVKVDRPPMTLGEWARRARSLHPTTKGQETAADLVIDDRRERSEAAQAHARR